MSGRATHGHTRGAVGTRRTSREFNAWCAMRARCHNPKCDRYPRYGARGIVVCERWRASFEAFLADMGPAPSPTHSIDRIDNDGNYEPSNCRWATSEEQANRRSNNRHVEHDGLSLTVAEWARRRDMSYARLQTRLDRGWPVHLALDPSAGRRELRAWRDGGLS